MGSKGSKRCWQVAATALVLFAAFLVPKVIVLEGMKIPLPPEAEALMYLLMGACLVVAFVSAVAAIVVMIWEQ